MSNPAGKPLSKFTYADVVRMERAEPRNAPQPPVEIAPVGGTTVVSSYHEAPTTATVATRGTTATTASMDTTSRSAWSRPNLEQLNLKIPRQFAEKFRMWCFMNRVSMAQAFVRSAQALMDGSGGTTDTTSGSSGGTTASHVLIDDLMIDDVISLHEEVITLYEEVTGNKFTDADRKALEEIKDIPCDRQKIGIALSVARAKGKINSFRYCHGAIKEAAESTNGELSGYLEYVRSKITQKAKTSNPKPR